MGWEKVIEKIPVDKAYDDLVHPSASSTGEVASIIPRTIHALLVPLEKWIIVREYSLKETEKILQSKLEHVNPDEIVSPEVHVAVPALQYISYSMDNEEIRDLYANLLSASMQKSLKGNVLPSFVEIIKQLTPDEARILKYLYSQRRIPLLKINRYDFNSSSGYITTAEHLSLLNNKISLEKTDMIPTLLDNLQRLNILELRYDTYFSDDSKYSEIEEAYASQIEILNEKFNGKYQFKTRHGLCQITTFGNAFCKICV